MAKRVPTVENCTNLLRDMVQINTCQPAGNELDLVKYIEGVFAGKKVEMTRLDHGNNRCSLVVKLPGESDMGGLALLSHLDTVAYGDESKWTYPPLSATIADGKLYGRGSADMKSGAASMIEMALCLLDNEVPLKKPVFLCFTADEEVNGLGVVKVAESGLVNNVDAAIIAEPSNEDIGLSEKGALWFRLHAKGKLSHGSRPEIGINAVEKCMEFVARLRPLIDVTEVHPALDTTTVSVTKLSGGIMTNVIPDDAVLEMDIRTLPSISHDKVIADAKDICAKMMEEKPGLVLELEIINNRPAVETAESDPFVEQLKAVHDKLGYKHTCKGLYFYTDASQLIPVIHKPFVIFGPADDKQAHQTNEFAPLEAVRKLAEIYLTYVMDYLV